MGEFGKFENAEELLRAYEELERCYTKKCQKCAELLRELEIKNNENAENDSKNDEFSVKNSAFEEQETESTNFANEKYDGTICSKDACADSTKEEQHDLLKDGAVAQEKDNSFAKRDVALGDLPVYLSPLFVSDAKEFFCSSKLASLFEREILELIAQDRDIATSADALSRAAKRVLGEKICEQNLDDKLVEALSLLPEVKRKVLDAYLANLRGRTPAPTFVAKRSGTVSGNRKFDSIEEAGKFLFRSL